MSNIIQRRSLLLAGAAAALIPAIAAASPELGKPAPLFTGPDSNGKGW